MKGMWRRWAVANPHIDEPAHDLRSPLPYLKGQAQLLRRRARRGQTDGVGLESGLTGISAASARVVFAIDETMDTAFLRAERALTLHVAPTDRVALIEAMAEETRQSTAQHVVR